MLSRISVRGSCWTFSAPQAVFRSWSRLRVVTRGSLASCTPSTLCWCRVFRVGFFVALCTRTWPGEPCSQGHGLPYLGAPTSGHGQRRSLSYTSEPPPSPGSTRLRFLFVRPVSVESPVVDMPVHGEHAGAARVRRERKMRSFWRHEQMAIQMVLASVQNHSHGVPRNQRTATRTGGEARDVPTRPSSGTSA